MLVDQMDGIANKHFFYTIRMDISSDSFVSILKGAKLGQF